MGYLLHGYYLFVAYESSRCRIATDQSFLAEP